MPEPIPIDDPEDERVADFVRLKDPDLRRQRDGGAGGDFFIAEGARVIRSLVSSRFPIRSLLLTPLRWESLKDVLVGTTAPVYLAPQEVVNRISGFPLHRGALGSADRLAPEDPAAVCAAAATVVVAEGINDHENLGSVFRNAAAFGAGAVLLDPSSCDPLYRRSVRVSMGHVLHVPFARLPAGEAGVALLRDLGFEVLALTPARDAIDVRSLSGRRRRAVLVGAEGPGLSAAALAAADRRVRIPMAAGVDSLNVATAAAVVLHELSRFDAC